MSAPETDVLVTAPTERPPVVVEIGMGLDPRSVTRDLDERGLDALRVALSRCHCPRCLAFRGGAS